MQITARRKLGWLLPAEFFLKVFIKGSAIAFYKKDLKVVKIRVNNPSKALAKVDNVRKVCYNKKDF